MQTNNNSENVRITIRFFRENIDYWLCEPKYASFIAIYKVLRQFMFK